LKEQGFKHRLFLLRLLVMPALLWFGASRVFADVEIDLDEVSKPTATPFLKQAPTKLIPFTPTPVLKAAVSRGDKATPTPFFKSKPTPTAGPLGGIGPTSTPTNEPSLSAKPTPQPEKNKVEEGEAVSEHPVVHGVLKMRDVYQAGIKSYQEKDYDQAIRYLKEAVKRKDPYTPKFYYAEAYATLGIIYQFHIIHYDKAYDYYKSALVYEKNNRTAKKHLKEVVKKLRGKHPH